MTPLQIDKIRELVRFRAPCVTIFLPNYRRGDQALNSSAKLLRNLAQDAGRRLETSHVPAREIEELLAPLRSMAEDPRADEGCHWPRALLRASGAFETIFLRQPAAAKTFAGPRFHVLPLLGELNLPSEFYVLKISRKHAGFFRVQYSVEPLPMPGHLPDNLTDFLNLDKPDHDRENRSFAGPGANRRIRFGTSAERETEPESASYYRALDHAVRELNLKAPLILAGVEEETALYRSVSTDGNLPRTIISEGASEREIIERGYALLRSAAAARAAKALADTRERLSPARLTSNLELIAAGAAEGRVARVFVRTGADSEALNAAVVETIRHGGDAIPVPQERMPDAPIAAALRY